MLSPFLFISHIGEVICMIDELGCHGVWRQGAWCSGLSCLHGKSDIAGSNPTLAFKLQSNKMFLPRSLVKIQYYGDREVVCRASHHQSSNLEYCVWRAVSCHAPHHPQNVLLAQFSLYVHKGGLKSHSFNLICLGFCVNEDTKIIMIILDGDVTIRRIQNMIDVLESNNLLL